MQGDVIVQQVHVCFEQEQIVKKQGQTGGIKGQERKLYLIQKQLSARQRKKRLISGKIRKPAA